MGFNSIIQAIIQFIEIFQQKAAMDRAFQSELLAELKLLNNHLGKIQSPPFTEEKLLDRLAVQKYLGFGPTTYKRKVAAGILKPIETAGGHRYYESDLTEERKESIRKGRI